MSDKKRFIAIGEAVFDILYLCTGMIVGFYLLASGGNTLRSLYGIMVLVLISGDSFHLVPRIRVGLTGDRERFARQLSVGKLVTSITMTVFYVVLWHIGLLYFTDAKLAAFTVIIYILAILRVILCLCPQNGWLAKQPSGRWGIYRNIPFLLLGSMVMVLFLINGNQGTGALGFMGGAVFLSFLFYVPVVLWAERYPAVGMLMLPKTCAYIWIICMGLFL